MIELTVYDRARIETLELGESFNTEDNELTVSKFQDSFRTTYLFKFNRYEWETRSGLKLNAIHFDVSTDKDEIEMALNSLIKIRGLGNV